MDVPAIFAGAKLFGSVEFLKNWLHLCGDIGHEKVFFIDLASAFGTIPKQAVGHAGLAYFFYDEADGIGFALR